MGAHHAGQRIAIGDADGGEPQLAGGSTISCACDAPRRNEKLVVAASSA